MFGTRDYADFMKVFGNEPELYEKLKPLKDDGELTWSEIAKIKWKQIDMENRTLNVPVARIVDFELSATDVKKVIDCLADSEKENVKYELTKGNTTVVFQKTLKDKRCGIRAYDDNKILFVVSEKELKDYLFPITASRTDGKKRTICSYGYEGLILNFVVKMKNLEMEH